MGKEKWLETGYRHFAMYGPNNFSINKISLEIESSRASFYHHFGESDIFLDELLTMHWGIIDTFIAAGKVECKNLLPDLYNLLAKYPIPLQFNLQLFHNRNKPDFNFIFIKSYAAIAKAFALQLFADALDLNPSYPGVFDLWVTVGEAWYSRLDPNDLSASTMQEHAREILQTVTRLKNSKLYLSLNQIA
ncbi:TetR/AcrR family transcriptional regulator [Maribellus sediminis]|uniref:TetR/AcrR family transcriptional regulator n=1 Tax=Maribellus sediminis TaxID=2696285 RepID=UPI00142FB9D4|nr:TetR/AcrR family transcriptional regulator [Maribellus sediminis]